MPRDSFNLFYEMPRRLVVLSCIDTPPPGQPYSLGSTIPYAQNLLTNHFLAPAHHRGDAQIEAQLRRYRGSLAYVSQMQAIITVVI